MLNKSIDILSIGEAMVELSCEGNLRQAQNFSRSFGGDTFNTAMAARRLGSSVAYITRLGNDAFGQAVQETILKEGIQIANPKAPRGTTGLYFASIDSQAEREFCYYRKDSAASLIGPEDVSEEFIQASKIVYASGISMAISESSCQAVIKAFELAQKHNVMTAFDPNYREALWGGSEKAIDAFNEILPLVDILLPSFPSDTANIIDFQRPEQVIDYFLFKGVKLVAAKVGAAGAYVGYKQEIQHVPALNVKPVDTTGAGDAFNGGFLHGLAQGEPLLQCARLGNVTAGLKILNRGSATAMPTKEAVYSRAF